MTRDYSNVPVTKTVTNSTENDMIIDLRDVLQMSLKIKANESVSLKVKTSAGLAVLTKKVEEAGLTLDESKGDVVVVTTPEELEEAITEAQDGETVELNTDITLSEDLILDKNVTLDLGTSTLSVGTKATKITGDVTLKGEGTITSSNNNASIVVTDGGKLTIDGATVESTKLYGVIIGETGEVVVKSGKIESKDSCIATNNRESKLATITINGGELTSDTDAVMYLPSPCNVTVNDGVLNGGISARMGTITINGGTINSITENNDSIEEYYNYSGNVWLGDAIACMAGTYTALDETQTNDLNININNGVVNGLCNGCSAVTIYNLGAVEQNINVTIKDAATLTVKDETQPVYKVVNAVDIVPEGAKDYVKYTTYTNTVNENISTRYLEEVSE